MSEEDFDTIIEEYEQALANMQREYDKRGERIEELEKQNASLEAAIKRQAGAARTLREYTLAEVRHLSDRDRSEYFAAQTVDSERDANAMLTDRIEELEKACNEWAEVSQSNYQRAKAAEAKLAQAVKLLELAVELARWNLNPKLRDDMIDFTTTVKGEQP